MKTVRKEQRVKTLQEMMSDFLHNIIPDADPLLEQVFTTLDGLLSHDEWRKVTGVPEQTMHYMLAAALAQIMLHSYMQEENIKQFNRIAQELQYTEQIENEGWGQANFA